MPYSGQEPARQGNLAAQKLFPAQDIKLKVDAAGTPPDLTPPAPDIEAPT